MDIMVMKNCLKFTWELIEDWIKYLVQIQPTMSKSNTNQKRSSRLRSNFFFSSILGRSTFTSRTKR